MRGDPVLGARRSTDWPAYMPSGPRATLNPLDLATQRELDVVLAAPSGPGFIALLEAFRATGGTAPGDILGRLLEEHQIGNAASLAKLVDSAQAFGFAWRDSLWLPMFQFDAKDLSLKAGAQSVRAALPSLWSGWMLASWFAAANARLDGHRPVDALGPDLDAVLQAARSLTSVVRFSPLLERRARAVAAHL